MKERIIVFTIELLIFSSIHSLVSLLFLWILNPNYITPLVNICIIGFSVTYCFIELTFKNKQS